MLSWDQIPQLLAAFEWRDGKAQLWHGQPGDEAVAKVLFDTMQVVKMHRLEVRKFRWAFKERLVLGLNSPKELIAAVLPEAGDEALEESVFALLESAWGRQMENAR